MNIALFGGTFDPIHNGHLRVARAAMQKFRLDRVMFVPTANPPHKSRRLTPFLHRYAMVSLACAGESRFVPSALEASGGKPHFSVDTLSRLKKTLGKSDRLFFLTGLDAFLDIPQWKQPGRLLGMADFIVVSRPGFDWRKIIGMIPTRMFRQPAQAESKTLALSHTTIHVLTGISASVSSSGIRKAIAEGRGAAGLIPRVVEEYIVKEGIYRPMRGSK
ncbi:MAG: nicotinate-nucleotide adenylyltransferase [Acidobacteriota bacterium]|nr:nicotinate-nucleotide adenylyltransferase [Acidobacteriota bacterium]